MLKATLERAAGSRVVLDIEVPPEEMAPEIDQAMRRLSRTARIPGFRPGRAPAALLERVVGRPRILEEALSPLVSGAYQKAVDEQGLAPIEQPSIEVRTFEDGQPLHFVATVAVKPEVRLGEYRSVRVQPEAAEVGPDEVARALEDLRAQRGTWVPIEEGAAEGDLVMLSLTGQVEDGPEIAERRQEAVVGTGRLRPEIDAGVRGLRPGESAAVHLVFGPDDEAQALRGKTAEARVELLECKRRELPELDDAFAAEVSDSGTLEELREELGNRLRRSAEARAEQAALDAAIAQVVDGAEVELPAVMVDRAVDNLVQDLRGQLRSVGGDLPQYLAGREMTEEGLRTELRPGAERRVKTSLVLEAVARDAGLWPGEAAVDAEIGRQAARSGLDPAHYRRVASRPENRAAIAADLARTEAIRLVRQVALPPAPEEPAGTTAAAGEGASQPTAEATPDTEGKGDVP